VIKTSGAGQKIFQLKNFDCRSSALPFCANPDARALPLTAFGGFAIAPVIATIASGAARATRYYKVQLFP
jgi:hypothetical protein